MIYFIPARKGSTRVKSKNMRHVNGKPLIEWTFQSLHIKGEEVMVSTNDPDVMELARAYGLQIFKRPDYLCEPDSKMSDVLFHALPRFCGHNEACVLYPTNPLRTAGHLVSARNLWKAKGSNQRTLMSVTSVDHRPYGLMSVDEGGFLKCNHPKGEDFYQSQGMPISYRANGAIFIIPVFILETRDINSQLFNNRRTIPFVMDAVSGFEVDEEHDLDVASALLKAREEKPLEVIYPEDSTSKTDEGGHRHVCTSDTA